MSEFVIAVLRDVGYLTLAGVVIAGFVLVMGHVSHTIMKP